MQTPCKRKTRYSENPPVEGHVGWVIDSTDHVTTASGTVVSEPAVAITAISQATGVRYVNERKWHASVTWFPLNGNGGELIWSGESRGILLVTKFALQVQVA